MARKKTKAAHRRLASWMLADLRRIAAVKRKAGQSCPAGPWLRTLADILSSAPPGKAAIKGHAPERFRLTYRSLLIESERCGLATTREEIEAQVADTLQWRRAESDRVGRPHHVPMSMDAIGELLAITEDERRAARAWHIGTAGGSKEARMEGVKGRHKDREARRRREAGSIPRLEYESSSLSKMKPWEALGVSRATYYRRVGRGSAIGETGPCETSEGRETSETSPCATSPCANNKGGETGPCANNISYRETASAASGLEACEQSASIRRDTETVLPSPAETPNAALARLSGMNAEPAPPNVTQPGALASRTLAAITASAPKPAPGARKARPPKPLEAEAAKPEFVRVFL